MRTRKDAHVPSPDIASDSIAKRAAEAEAEMLRTGNADPEEGLDDLFFLSLSLTGCQS